MKLFKTTLLVLGMSAATASLAATVTLSGDDVSFTYDDATMYGAGMVVGNSLFFQPTNFVDQSLNGAGVVTANETLIIDVLVTSDNHSITSLGMFEEGDYIVNGTGASVAASGRLGVTSNATTCAGAFGPLACSSSSIFNVAGLGDTGGAGADWSGGTSVNLADTAGWGSDTSLQLSFQNDLTATTLATGEQGFIAKKFSAIGLVVVPVPAAVWLFGSGLLGLVAVSRRRES